MSNSPPFAFVSVQTDTLGDQISRQLLNAIIEGRYHPGDRFPGERDLAAAFGASRIAVRDAIGRLSTLGIVTVRQGVGTSVNPMSKWNSLDPLVFMLLHHDQAFGQLLEVRRIVEPELAFLAAQRITDEQIQKMRPLAVLLEDDTEEQHVERDTQFHLKIAHAAENQVLLTMLYSISELLRESRRRTYAVPGEIAKGHEWHQQILSAIETKDAEAARCAMRGHLCQVEDALIAAEGAVSGK